MVKNKMSKIFDIGDIIVVTQGVWDDYDIDQVIVAIAKFDWQDAVEGWKKETKIDELTPRNFLNWLFNQRLIKKIDHEEFCLSSYPSEWSNLKKR